MKKILVIGSSNTDMVIKADHIPAAGETILGGKFFMNPGGKGANQAVAAARLGGNVTFICKTGKDIFGDQSEDLFKKEGIDTSYLLSDSNLPSGVALITVDKKGENSIVVASGANGELLPDDLGDIEKILDDVGIILMQLEIPIATVDYIAGIASTKKITFVLNPAPATSIPDSLLKKVNIITPNESEAEILSGVRVKDWETAEKAAILLRDKGIKTVIITMGKEGALVSDGDEFKRIPSISVDAIDSTAAGDVFNGALVVALAEDKSLHAATEFACRAAAISVTRLGAQASAPYRHELEDVKRET